MPNVLIEIFAEDISLGLIIIAFCLISLGFFIYELKNFIAAKLKFNSNLNLKSVEFSSNGVTFNYTNPQHNFVCKYSDIKNVDIELCTAKPQYRMIG